MSYKPESTVAWPSSNYSPQRRQHRPPTARISSLPPAAPLFPLVGSSYLYFGPGAGMPISDCLVLYYAHPLFPGSTPPRPPLIPSPHPPTTRALLAQDIPPAAAWLRRVLRLCTRKRVPGGWVCGGAARYCAVWRVEMGVAGQRKKEAGVGADWTEREGGDDLGGGGGGAWRRWRRG
ncbi:hypothetical protein B0H13DRAFT_1875568 [Mycena leptocephala]|nr:hypothetical protein B0H13DRAFT_1875568 [Mycena leptocephala]